jgi:hypothetical protein
MSDDLQNRNAPDNQRINLNQEHEVRYWTQKFKVSREDLRNAIDAVGPIASAVEQRLRGGASRT